VNRLVHMRRHRGGQGFGAGDGLHDEALWGLREVKGDRMAWEDGMVAISAALHGVAAICAKGHR